MFRIGAILLALSYTIVVFFREPLAGPKGHGSFPLMLALAFGIPWKYILIYSYFSLVKLSHSSGISRLCKWYCSEQGLSASRDVSDLQSVDGPRILKEIHLVVLGAL
ncbi:hypothetical protein D9757_001223 [Collybiopsis confluens]|uniref:Uncharacterized protein n=1 Tax=Collybiopsis confluens TaxID=2823264 RepID=A0A8H5MFZ6_9AGAR|nr:hypothetical protein D9757_001223 [Collybiopsis confluens]